MKPYKDEMSALHFSQSQKDEMVQFLRDNAGQAPKVTVRPFRVRRVAAVAAAAAVCLTATAFALPGSPLRKLASEAFSGVFGGDLLLADSVGASLGIPVTKDGITVTADAVIGDESNLSIVYSVTRDDGTPFETGGVPGRLMFQNDETFIKVARLATGAHGSSYFADSDADDAALQYVQKISVEDGVAALRGKTLPVSLGELMYLDGTDDGKLLSAGPWEFQIPLDYTDQTKHFQTGQTVKLADKEFTITGVALSPIGFRFELVSREPIPFEPFAKAPAASTSGGGVAILEDGTEEPLSGGDYDTRDVYYDSFSVSLQLSSGELVDFTESGGSMVNEKDGRLVISKSGTFPNLIAAEDMRMLTLCGAEIPLSQ